MKNNLHAPACFEVVSSSKGNAKYVMASVTSPEDEEI